MFKDTEAFFRQIVRLYDFRTLNLACDDNVYVKFLESLSQRDRRYFDVFMRIYLNKANIELADYTVSPLGLACLQIAMEYYFL